MATIGQQLLQPESGWKRIDDQNDKINVKGVGTPSSGVSKYWNATRTTVVGNVNNSNYIEFKFYGTKLRIIGDSATALSSLADSSVSIEVDGVRSTFTNIYSASNNMVLLFEKANLNLENHTVKIYPSNGKTLWFDAIDIDDVGIIGGLINKILLLSNNKPYSLKSEEVNHTTNMTSNTAPSPFVVSASTINSSSYPAWYAFNGSNTSAIQCWMSAANTPTGWIQIDYGSSKKVNRLTLTSRNDATASTMSPKDFKVLGSVDGVAFSPLATVANQTTWTSNQTVVFDFDNHNSYRYYRLEVTANNGATSTAIGEILYSFVDRKLLELNKGNDIITYGADSIKNLNMSMRNKGYLMTAFNNNVDGLREKQLTKKPLSIRFD